MTRPMLPPPPFPIPPAQPDMTRAASVLRIRSDEEHMVWVDTYSMRKPTEWMDEVRV